MTWAESRQALFLALACLAWPAQADEDEITDMEFLEYLGSWEESDEEWLIFDEEAETADAGGKKPDKAKDEESAEQEDEA